MAFAPNGHLWLATYSQGVYELDTVSLMLKHYGKNNGFNKTFIYSMVIDKKGNVWLGTGGDGLKVLDPGANTITKITTVHGLAEMTVTSLLQKDDNIYAVTVKGLSVIEQTKNSYRIFNYDKPQGFESTEFNANAAMQTSDGKIWWGIGEVLTIFDPRKDNVLKGKTFITSIDIMEKELLCSNGNFYNKVNVKDTIWTSGKDTFYFKNNIPIDTGYFAASGIKWTGTEGVFNLPRGLVLPYHQDHITFHFASDFISNTNKTIYRYKLEGTDGTWNKSTLQTYVDYRNLAPGDYTFIVCSSNFNGPFTESARLSFTITPPWWRTIIAYIIYALLFIAAIVGYNRIRTNQLLKRQHELEKNVKERTAEIEEQKNEIGHQKQLIEEKQQEIVDSISYAKRLQEAILPSREFVNTHLKDNFIYYQPKDIVAGDFYWAEKVNDLFFIAAADSTGHGVPGAMVSVVCSNALNRTIKEFKLTDTGKILDKTRELVLETFEKSVSEVKDGMDISLLCIDKKNKKVTWSGANNPLWYVSPATMGLLEIKADKQPIGKTEYPKPFITHELDYMPNSTFYLFTDGFADQFGGPKSKKFMSKNLKELLLNNSQLPLDQQKQLLETTFTNWVGNLDQIDDVSIIGIRI